MPLGGSDTNFDQSWSELDKIKRRLELRYRLKEEGIRRRYDPFLQLGEVRFADPAIDRYADLRKRGRSPGTPLQPKLFYRMVSLIFLPAGVMWYYVHQQVSARWAKLRSGETPYEDRPSKSVI